MIPCSGFIEEVQNVRTSTKGTIQHKGHFLPPGVAHTTGLSHNPFTWRPLQARSYHYAKKLGLAHYFVKISLNVANFAPYRAYDNVRDSLEKLV